MSEQRISYSAVLADLEIRKNALNSRISSIDAAIEGIRELLDASPRARVDAGSQPQVTLAAAPTQRTPPSLPAQNSSRYAVATRPALARTYAHAPLPNASVHSKAAPPDRRKSGGLNIYVNRFPDWSRAMSRGTLSFRKKAEARCPNCGSSDTRESTSRSVSDIFLLLFDYTSARCRNCDSRFRIWKTATTGEFPSIAEAK